MMCTSCLHHHRPVVLLTPSFENRWRGWSLGCLWFVQQVGCCCCDPIAAVVAVATFVRSLLLHSSFVFLCWIFAKQKVEGESSETRRMSPLGGFDMCREYCTSLVSGGHVVYLQYCVGETTRPRYLTTSFVHPPLPSVLDRQSRPLAALLLRRCSWDRWSSYFASCRGLTGACGACAPEVDGRVFVRLSR